MESLNISLCLLLLTRWNNEHFLAYLNLMPFCEGHLPPWNELWEKIYLLLSQIKCILTDISYSGGVVFYKTIRIINSWTVCPEDHQQYIKRIY